MYHVSDNFKRSVNSKNIWWYKSFKRDAKNSVDLFLRGRQKISRGGVKWKRYASDSIVPLIPYILCNNQFVTICL